MVRKEEEHGRPEMKDPNQEKEEDEDKDEEEDVEIR